MTKARHELNIKIVKYFALPISVVAGTHAVYLQDKPLMGLWAILFTYHMLVFWSNTHFLNEILAKESSKDKTDSI